MPHTAALTSPSVTSAPGPQPPRPARGVTSRTPPEPRAVAVGSQPPGCECGAGGAGPGLGGPPRPLRGRGRWGAARGAGGSGPGLGARRPFRPGPAQAAGCAWAEAAESGPASSRRPSPGLPRAVRGPGGLPASCSGGASCPSALRGAGWSAASPRGPRGKHWFCSRGNERQVSREWVVVFGASGSSFASESV